MRRHRQETYCAPPGAKVALVSSGFAVFFVTLWLGGAWDRRSVPDPGPQPPPPKGNWSKEWSDRMAEDSRRAEAEELKKAMDPERIAEIRARQSDEWARQDRARRDQLKSDLDAIRQEREIERLRR